MLRSGAMVLVANVVDVAAVLIRNIILARLLPVEQFGLAATFSILMTMIETFQNVGLNRLVVQDARSDDPAFVGRLHGAQIAVGLVAAPLLAALAYPFALIMGTPGMTAAYLLLALVPLANAFVNLETFRMQRQGRFGPQVLRSMLSQPVGLLAVFPAYWWLGDHRAALVAIIAQQSAAMLLTHVNVRPIFRIAFDRAVMRAVAAFGWPLIVNGLLMFAILNGDRIIVLHRFGPAALGWFSAVVMLTLTPANLIVKSLQTITLPALSRTAGEAGAFQRIYDGGSNATAVAALAAVLGSLLFGHVVIALLFGSKFMPAAAFLAPLACMNALRLLRAMPAIAAMAHGETRNPLYANLVRALGVPAAVAAAALTGTIEAMIVAGIAAEIAGAVAAGALAHQRAGISGAHYNRLLLSLTLCVAAALTIVWGSGYAWLLLVPLAVMLLLQCAARLDVSALPYTARLPSSLRRRSHRA
ncbi:oligosaccharide flippase family protein [Sphingomonas mucosissima]|uniref:Colanic acid exporter n=1 Tax=Sphingomonas mucosissima TaxID=370959 RepID=A0A245ZRW1_9SPHN|nr:oligosaccharide flippase family protein [Sphingomonas mucosissima]OWK32472.1 colanic acid exporter [Sphingomonas mucosissima]